MRFARELGETPRPFVAFAAADRKTALRLYRAQHVIWIWIGLAAVLQAVAYFTRPHLGMALVTSSPTLDVVRSALFAAGGLLIVAGVWTVRRALEVLGHVFFAVGAVLNGLAVLSIPGNQVVSAVLTFGVALASGWRAYFIVEWISAVPGVLGHRADR